MQYRSAKEIYQLGFVFSLCLVITGYIDDVVKGHAMNIGMTSFFFVLINTFLFSLLLFLIYYVSARVMAPSKKSSKKLERLETKDFLKQAGLSSIFVILVILLYAAYAKVQVNVQSFEQTDMEQTQQQ